ncbi:MAG: heat-inducible transcriptional repressor HrcA [Clostridia bacterium]|nr:heat-inducible transcriptional repressor HrcA [Clostridia bacterium]
MDLNERKLQILQAIIADFISTGEPVGSRTLSKNPEIEVSAATIRNEMADLEEMGYLTHPHTSAGRIPSDKAYRLYVDEFMDTSDLPDDRKEAIREKLSETRTELDATIEHAAELLSEMTNLTSFAITPQVNENKLKYIQFLPVDERTVVLMLVSEKGKVLNKAIRLSVPYTEENLELMSKVMTHNYMGKTISSIMARDIIKDFTNDMSSLAGLAKDVAPSFMKTLQKMLDVDLYMNGYTNVFDLPEYSQDPVKSRNFLQLLENKSHLKDVIVNRDEGLVITIGDENSEDMQDVSLITADYKVNGKLVGKLGVIGPKRMKYGEISSVIKYISENISETFEVKGETDD